ncbi:MAG: MBL fold metallo-hydrolase, partial [Solirubrobacterales bacterium]
MNTGDEVSGRPEIARYVAPNPSPMTLGGTNTYLVGRDPSFVIDPGPAIPSHVASIRAEANRRGGIGGILLTHSHFDHSEAVGGLDAPLLWGEPATEDEAAALTAAQEHLHDALRDGEQPGGKPAAAPDGASSRLAESAVGPFTVVPTPGHAADHVAFIWGDVCFCGDLILGEGSSIVPPNAGGGSLHDYLGSLRRLAKLDIGLMY